MPTLLFTDLSLLLAIGAIALLITTELSSPYYGQTTLTINRRKLKNVALLTSAMFLVTAAITIIQILSS